MDGSTPLSSPSSLLQRSLGRERGYERLHVEGRLPDDLEGTLFRVGPGLFDSVGVPVTHLFEADGAITAIRIGNGAVDGAVRIIDSAGLRDERAAGVPLYGPRASYPRRLASALRGRNKNTANTAPMVYQGRLFAMMEAAKPTELDPNDLTTIGEVDLDGVVKGAFSAHPHRVASRRATYNFGVRYGRTTLLDLYELPDEGTPRRLSTLTLERPVMLHDFIATSKHLVFFVDPFEVNVPRAVLQLGGFGDMFRFRAEHGSEIIVVPIDDPSRPTRFRVPAFYQWHFGNAFEDGSALFVDFVRYDDARSFHTIGFDEPLGGELVRARIEPDRGTLDLVVRSEGMVEFPLVDPRFAGSRSRTVFTNLESTTFRGVARTDLDTGAREAFRDGTHTWYSEPVFVPKRDASEGVGYLLSLVLDARAARTHLAIFDSQRISEGPVARAFFEDALPITFHGIFLDACG